MHSFECQCPEGWAGSVCEEAINPAFLCHGEEDDCGAHATCTHTGPGTHDCDCFLQYGAVGGSCVEQPVAQCLPNCTLWTPPPAVPSFEATGGTVSTVDGWTIHTFTRSGTLNVLNSDGGASVEYLVVGGGGGGGDGNAGGGGGGAGGLVEGTLSGDLLPRVGSYSVTVGDGGATCGASNQCGQSGGDSTVALGSVTIRAQGGGHAGCYGNPSARQQAGADGGSGGGGSSPRGPGAAGHSTQPAAPAGGTAYGNDGAAGCGSSNPFPGSGGGGAGGRGQQCTSGSGGGNGGAGRDSSISGSSVGYAGGGGGCIGTGTHGGGNGGRYTTYDGTPGQANTGGGGGGACDRGFGQTAGGSGIVIVRYAA